MNIYDYEVEKPNGEMLKLNDYKGNVIIIINSIVPNRKADI